MRKKNRKIATTTDQQITRLRVRRFQVKSTKEKDARKFLNNVGYYRLSGYILPYYNKKKESLNSDLDFFKIVETYWFDKELKNVLLYLISAIEVEYKTRIADTLCVKYGSHFYYDSSYFKDPELHKMWLNKFEENMNYSDKNDDLFKNWYKQEYDSKFPLWVAFQLVNFNDLSKFYDLLDTKYKKDLRSSFGGIDYPFTQSWLRSTTVIRNIAAHNGRLFYRTLSVTPKKPTALRKTSLNLKRLFVFIVAMKELCTDEYIWDTFFSRLINLICKYPDVDLIHYGFPVKWYDILNS